MKKTLQTLFILILLILPFSQVSAQGWVPVGQPMLGEPTATTEYNGELYVAYSGGTSVADSGLVTIEKWNGLFWTVYGQTKYTWPSHISDLIFYKDTLYVSGSFPETFNSYQSILRYDGKHFDVPDNGIKGLDISAMEIYKGDLYVAGRFNYAGRDSAYNIAKFNGTNWSFVGTHANSQRLNRVGDLHVHNDTLYVIGQFNYHPDSSAYQDVLYCWDGSNWQTIDVPEIFLGYSITTHQNLLTIAGRKKGIPAVKVLSYHNKSWINKSDSIPSGYYGGSIVSQNNILWITIYTGHLQPYLFYWSNGYWQKADEQLQSNTAYYDFFPKLFLFQNELHAINQDRNKYIHKLHDSVGIVKGKVYADLNKNCVKNFNEKNLEALIQVLPNNYYYSTYNNGEYTVTLPLGTHQIKASTKYYEVNSCQPATRTVQLTSYTVIDSQDFAMSPIPGIRDLRTAITGHSGNRARQGFTESYTLYFNQYTPDTVSNIELFLEHGPNVLLDTAYMPYDSYQNNILRWNIGQIDPDANRGNNRIFIKFKVPLSTSLGDTVKFFARILPAAGDTVPENNYDTLIQVVTAAIDPNDKQSNPEGEIKKTTKKIDYLIRFQNTGTDTAYRVVVVDTIDTNLPLTEVVMNSSSHPYKLEVQNNVLIWHFYNILLPDSHINEPESHGFIRYTAGIRPGLAEGDSIINRAYIYFDYQKPIITNTVMSKVESPVGIKEKDERIFLNGFSIYPNPTSGNLTLTRKNVDLPAEIKVYSTTGALIHTSKWQAYSTQSNINLGDLAPGLYLLRINQPNGVVTKRVIVNK